VRVDTHLVADRWRGARLDPVDRTEVRQRLQLGVFGDPEADGPRWRLDVDLSVGSDLGPTPAELEALPDGRRARLEAHTLELVVHNLAGVLDLRAGRHVLYDALGFDAMDGATARLRLVPRVTFEGSAGLAARQGWSEFGPDIYEPDGAALSSDAGYVLGAAVETRDLSQIRARASWRRLFDDEVQRADAGLALAVGPFVGLRADAGVRYDTLFERWVDLWAGVDATAGPLRAGARWRRVTPTFSADSIWNAFGARPYDALDLSLGAEAGPWRLSIDGGARRFDADARAADIGARAIRRLSRDARIGVEGRSGFGYGGERHYGDVFATLPLPTQAPLSMRLRAGAVQVEAPSGWGLVALSWRPGEQVRIEALSEAYAGVDRPYRVRAMGRVVVEEWL